MNSNVHAILYRMLDSFFRHRWLFFLSLITVTGVTTTTLYLRSKTYTATAATQVLTAQKEMQEAIGQGQTISYITPAQQQINTFNDLLNDNQTGGFLDKALQNAALQPVIVVDPRANDPRFAEFRKGLTTHPVSDNIFAIELVWPNQGECERIVRSLQQEFIDFVGEYKQSSSVRTTTFLKTHLAQLKAKMEEADNQKVRYQQTHAGLTPEAQASELERLADTKSERDILQNTSDGNDKKIANLQERLKSIAPEKETERTVTNVSTEHAIQYNNLERKKLLLLDRGFQPTSNSVQDIDDQITALKKVMTEESQKNKKVVVTQGQKIEANPRYEALQNELDEAIGLQSSYREQLKQINHKIVDMEQRSKDFAEATRQFENYKRDADSLHTDYTNTLHQLMQTSKAADIEKLGAAATLRPIGQTFAEPTTSKSKMILMFGGSLVLGLMVALIMVIVGEWLDPTLRYESDLAMISGIPVLGTVLESMEIKALPTGGMGNTPQSV